MKYIFPIRAIAVISIALLLPVVMHAKPSAPSSHFAQALGKAPLLFTPNMGQVADVAGKLRPDVLYTATNGSMKLFLFSNAISYQFTKLSTVGKSEQEHGFGVNNYRFSLELVASNSHPIIRRELQSMFTENFYLPQCRDGITGVPTYGRLVYQDVYPGVDWVIYNKDNQLEYDFAVKAGADISKIRMKIKDGGPIPVAADGSLVIKTPLGEVRQHAPYSFVNGKRIQSHFTQYGDGSIGFAVPDRDKNSPIIIDPSVSWASYFGGNSNDQVNAVTVSGTSVYLVGTTLSTSGIADSINSVTHCYQKAIGGGTGANTDQMIVKMDNTGALQWATYYGASGGDLGLASAADASGNLYVAGSLGGGDWIFNHRYLPGGYRCTVNKIQQHRFKGMGFRLWWIGRRLCHGLCCG